MNMWDGPGVHCVDIDKLLATHPGPVFICLPVPTPIITTTAALQ